MSSFVLHILAMLLMLCDHLQLTLLPELPVLRCIGRLAFPLFAFMAVEGYLHTRSLKNISCVCSCWRSSRRFRLTCL